MAKCPWTKLLGEHDVPDFNDDESKVGDPGICGKCRNNFRVAGINPCKLARSGKKSGKKPGK